MAQELSRRQAGGTGPEGPVAAAGGADVEHPVVARLRGAAPTSRGGSMAWLLSGRLTQQVLQFASTLVLARLLVPTDYGLAALCLTVTGFALLLSDFGIGTAVVRSRSLTDSLLSTALTMNLMLAGLLTAVVAALAWPLASLFDEPRLLGLLLLGSTTYAVSLSLVHTAVLELAGRFRLVAKVELSCFVLGVCTSLALAAAGVGAASLVAAHPVSRLSTTVVLWTVVRWRPTARPTRRDATELFGISRGLTAFGLLAYLGRNVDNLVLGLTVAPAQLGLYSRSYNLVRLPVTQATGVLNRVLLPVYRRSVDDLPALRAEWASAHTTAALGLFPLAALMACAAPSLIEVLYGPRWLGMVPLFQLLTLSMFTAVTPATLGPFYPLFDRTGVLVRLGVVQVACTLVGVGVGVQGGVTGVAVGVLLSSVVAAALFAGHALRMIGLGARAYLPLVLRPLAAVLPLSAAVLAVRFAPSDQTPAWQVLVAQLCVAALTYAGSVRLLYPAVHAAGVRRLRARLGRQPLR